MGIDIDMINYGPVESKIDYQVAVLFPAPPSYENS